MKTIQTFLFLLISIYGICQSDPNSIQFTKDDSLILDRYYQAFSETKDESKFLEEINKRVKADVFQASKSSLQSKKLSTTQPLNIDSSSKIAIVSCQPNFSTEYNFKSSFTDSILKAAGSSISNDIAHLMGCILKITFDFMNTDNHLIILDSGFVEETPFDPYSFILAPVDGPTLIWGTSQYPDYIFNQGITCSKKPKLNKKYIFKDKQYINGAYDYILAIWPYQWFSGWAGFNAYSMYFLFFLIDGKTGQILGNGLSHKDKNCDTYCGMEVAWTVSLDIATQLLKAFSLPK